MNFIKKLIGILLLIVTQLSAKIDGQRVGCGGTYSNLSGIISSPNYPSNYDDDMDCAYYIQVPPPNSVNISFISFAMKSCCDWLQVSCTSGSTKPVQRFSGTNLPPFLSISSCYTVQLLFYTDSSGVAQGFSLRYGIGNGLQGGLTMKPINLHVRNDSTEPIVLSCSSRANQPDVYPWWSYSFNDNRYVEILTTSNCSISSSLWLLTSSYFSTTRQYPSRTCNLTISRSSFPAATRIYTCTDSTLDFSNTLITDCGGMHTDLSGIISSPNYPSNYSNNMDCVFYIQISPPYSVNITFISFATESYFDYLQVSCTNDSTKPVQRFSGTNLPPFLSISSCYNVQLLFHTNGFKVAQGFILRYDIGNGLQGGLTMKPMNLYVRNDSTEPIVLSCSSGANQPDVYPWWFYSFNDDRYGEILTTSDCGVSSSLIILNPDYFNTTRQYSSRTCNLTISRSHFPSAAGMYTCTDSTLDFFNALITFADCGGTHTGLSGIISSPNYPSDYSNNLNCYYYIQSSPSNSVNITFISFATESCCDWLQVSCSSDSTKTIQRFSGTTVPPFLSISSCYNVQLLFHTDSAAVHEGFSLRYDIENETGNNNLNTVALIVGVVVGIVVLLIVVAIVVFFCLRRKRIPKTPDPSATTNVDPQNDNLYEMFRRNTQHANEGENITYDALNYDTLE